MTEELFYIQDTRTYLGNAMVWWGKGGSGYTCDIQEAGQYTKQKAQAICKRETDLAWPCKYIDGLYKKTIQDYQYVNKAKARGWRTKK